MDTRMSEEDRQAFQIVTSEIYKRANIRIAETAESAQSAE